MSEASVNMLNSLQHLCRICLHQLGEVKIFGEPQLDSTISLCLDILVLSNDGGPQSICCDCKDKLNGIMIFRLIGERSRRQLELILGRFEDYYAADDPNPETVECQPDVTTFAIHPNVLPDNPIETSNLPASSTIIPKSLNEYQQIGIEMLQTESEPKPSIMKQESDSETSTSVIQETASLQPVVSASSISQSIIPSMASNTPDEYNCVPPLKISVRTDLLGNQNGSSYVPASLDSTMPSRSGVNGNLVLLEAIPENSAEIPEKKYSIRTTRARRNINAIQDSVIKKIKGEGGEAAPSKIIKQRTRRTSLEPSLPPFCEICNKLFASRTSLYLHNRLHTQEKAHICPQCNKIFSSSTELSRHIRVHTGEKPYSCEICGKSFTQKVSMRKHQEKLHSVQKFEEKFVKPEVGEVKGGLVNNLDVRVHTNSLVNQPNIRAGEYSGNLVNQPDNSVGEYSGSLVNQPDNSVGEYLSSLVNQPDIRAGEYSSSSVNQPDIGSDYAGDFVNHALNNEGELVNQLDSSVREQGDSLTLAVQSIKMESSVCPDFSGDCLT